MADQRPNIIFIMTDQQRYDTINALGVSFMETPNLDRLVKGHCHELDLDLVAEDGEPLLHRHAYYTVNAIPSASPR